jgi:hypothetical protein
MRRRSIYRNWFLRTLGRRGAGNGYAAITLAALTAIASGTVTATARMSISGTQILNTNGAPFVPRGMGAGHGELVRVGDEVIAAAMGANVRRIGIRFWTDDTSSYLTDAESDADPGHLKPAYWAETLAQINRTRAAGMKVHLFFDSDCGQGVGTGAVCDLGSGVVNFASNTPESNAKRTKYLEMIMWVISQTIGLVDSIEVLVEPAGNFTESTYWDFVEEVMDAVLVVDPAMLFVVGGHPNYQATDIGSAFRPGWNEVGSPYQNHLIATCNALSNLATNAAQRVDRVNNYMVPARIALNAPVLIQQVGTRTSEDADDAHLDAMLTLLDQAAGGPIGYMVWEETSVFSSSYGFNSLSNTGDPNSSRVVKANRKAVLQAHFTGSYVNAAITLGALTSTGVGTRGHAGTLAKTLSPLTAVGSGTAGGGTQTVLDLRMMGGQITTPQDYSGDAIHQDLMKRARNFSATSGGNPYQNQGATTLLRVASMTRVSNVVSVVLSAAPGSYETFQDIATGHRLVLTCLADPTFDADHATITVTDQTNFTYNTTGQANATYTAVNQYDIAAAAINQKSIGSDGHPVEDFFSILSTVSGTATSAPDLNGTYSGVFPGTPPSNFSVAGAALSDYTPGGSTFTITVDSTDTAFIGITCTGVSAGFKVPRIIRSDHDQTGNTYCRPDFAQFLSRYAVLRFMDGGRTNSNAFIKSWDKRPKVSGGLGMPIEDMVALCNELGCDLWYCFPHWVTDDYVTRCATLIRDTLRSDLNVCFEFSNENWNDGTFPHLFWNLTFLRTRLKAHFHSSNVAINSRESVITSVTKVAGVVTVNMNRAPPFANGATAVFKITEGSTSGYNTADTGATMTVSGNSFSFSGNSGSGTATVTQATIIGRPTDPIYAWDKATGFRDLATRMQGVRTYEIAQLVKAVFGGVLNGRARILLMGWHTNFAQFGLLEYNALQYLEAQYGSTKDWLWGLGGAPYPNATGSTNAAVLAAIQGDIDSQETYFHRASYLAHRYAHSHMQYEGGPDLTNLGSNHTLIDGLYDANEYRLAQKYILDHAFALGVDVHVPFYTSSGTPGGPGSETWHIARGLAADGGAIGSATTSRIQGIDDVLLAAPPAYADPNKLPGTLYFQGGSGYVDDTTGTLNNNGMRQLFSSSNQLEDLFYVDPANDGNNIVLTVWGGIKVGGGANGVRVYLDDVLVGTCNLATTTSLAGMDPGGDPSPGTITLTAVAAGKHRLKVKAPASQPDEVGVSKVVGV